MNNNITIRKAEEHDIDTMCLLLAGLFAIETDFETDVQKQRNALNLLIMDDDKAVFVAMSDQSIIGMITGQLVVSTAAGGYSVLLEDLFVMPEYRGKGIASMLIRYLLSWGKAKGAVRIQLVADENNSAALELYKKTGFSVSSMRGLYKII
jgi:ribosomal protein S18 acetylase RimI-like enzyme